MISILSVITTASLILITTVKQSTIKMNVLSDLDSQSSALGQLVRSQLGGLDNITISDIASGDSACLTADNHIIRKRAGFALEMPVLSLQQDSSHIANTSFSAIGGNSSRSVSFWLLIAPEMTGRQRLIGWGDETTEAGYFGIAYDADRLAVELGDNTEMLTQSLSIDDGAWHHIGLRYDGVLDEDNFQLFIDGVLAPVNFIALLNSLQTDQNDDNQSGLIIGGNTERRPFHGAIADIRLFDAALSSDQLSHLADNSVSEIPQSHLKLHYLLSSDPDPDHGVTDLSGMDSHGHITHLDDFRIVSASSHRFTRKQIALYPSGDDDRYAAYLIDQQKTAQALLHEDCPATPPETASKLTDAVFTKQATGFFSRLDNSSSVILGAGLSSEADRVYGQNITSRHWQLSSAKSHKDRCRIAPDFQFSDSTALSCSFTNAYIHIISDYDYADGLSKKQDRLIIPQADKIATEDLLTFSNLPFDKGAGLSASYDPDRQLMVIHAENHALNGAEWQQLMRAISFETDAKESELDRQFIFSLGAPAYLHEDGLMRYLRFVPEQAGISFSDAQTAAGATSLCGMTGYLATLTSHAEMTAFAQFSRPIPDNKTSLQRGWIGASDQDVEGVWRWLYGPEAGLAFWSGTGVGGQLYNHDNLTITNQLSTLDIGFADDMGIDDIYHPSFGYRLADNQSQSTRFTAWAVSSDNLSYPDNSSAADDFLMMSIDSQFRSLWANQQADAACHDIMPQASFAPCGYFIEWGGISQSQPLLAETRSILFDEWAEICF